MPWAATESQRFPAAGLPPRSSCHGKLLNYGVQGERVSLGLGQQDGVVGELFFSGSRMLLPGRWFRALSGL